jgi:hypothetical protein
MEHTLPNRLELLRKGGWQGSVLSAGVVLLLGLAVWMIVSQFTAGDGAFGRSAGARERAAFEEETGIRLVRVALTAGGGMIDLQYQVIDPDKSLVVHDDKNPPMLVDGASGLLLATPFHDHSFRELHTAVTYHELIMNGDGLIERGSKIILTVGDSRLEHVVVQ